MDPDKTLEEMRRAHGVSRTFAARLLPLVLRAADSSPEKRARLLGIVERSLAAEAERKAAMASGVRDPGNRELEAIADLLHDWRPPVWLRVWEQQLRRREEP